MEQTFKNRTAIRQPIHRIGGLEPIIVESFCEVTINLNEVYQHELKRIERFFYKIETKVLEKHHVEVEEAPRVFVPEKKRRMAKTVAKKKTILNIK